MAGSDTDSFLTAEPAIVVDEDIDDEFIDASIRGAELKKENSRHSRSRSPGSIPFNEVTRGTAANVMVSNGPMLLSPTRVPFSNEHESASFGASDLARSNNHSYNGRESPHIMTNDLTHNPLGANTGMRNDALPPIPPDNIGRTQHGVTVRRAVHKCRRMSMVNQSKYKSSRSIENVNFDEKSVISPFDRSLSSRNLDTSLNGRSPHFSPSPRTRAGLESPEIMRVDSGQYT